MWVPSEPAISSQLSAFSQLFFNLILMLPPQRSLATVGLLRRRTG